MGKFSIYLLGVISGLVCAMALILLNMWIG